jgi:hypothetical protein
MKINRFNHQIELLEKIKEKVQQSYSYADEIADLLEISKDAVYRRMRGETSLSLDEAMLLIHHFQLDNPFQITNNTVNFQYESYTNENNEIQRYLQKLISDLELIRQEKTSELIFCAEDVPLFHYFNFPLLAAFKLFYWQKSILYTDSFQDKIFSTTIIDENLIALSKELTTKYTTVPSIEIWTENTINSVLQQIEFYYEAGYIPTKEITLAILEEVKLMVDTLENQTINGTKNQSNASFQFFLSDITIGNNCILAKNELGSVLYLSYNTFNILKSNNIQFIQENEKWINRIIDNSIPLSKSSQKIRNKFFQKIRNKIDLLIKSIK